MKLGYSCAFAAAVACSCSPFPDLDHLTGRASPGPDGSSGGPWVEARTKGPATCDLVAEERYLKSSAPRRTAWFGTELAAEDDTIVVTAPFENDTWEAVPSYTTPDTSCDPAHDIPKIDVMGAGAVRVFERAGAAWSEDGTNLLSGIEDTLSLVQPTIVPPLYRVALFTTYSVALSGNRIAVGLAGDSSRDRYRGSVRLFERSKTGWAETARIEERLTAAFDFFGIRVAMAGDLLAVAAIGDEQPPWDATDGTTPVDTVPSDSGAVYLYQLGEGAPRLLRRLKAPFMDELAWFGANIAVNSKWLAIGAPLEDFEPSPGGDAHAESAGDAGAVYVYSRNGTTVELIGEPLRGEATGHPVFGAAVALSGDWLAVGAPWTYQNGVIQRGAVHLYELSESGATPVKTLVSGDDHGNLFGYKLAFGSNSLVVGAVTSDGPSDDREPIDAAPGKPFFESTGSAYVFEHGASGWNGTPCRIKASNAGPCDVFGSAVGVARDTIVVSAPLEDGSDETRNDDLLDAGALYLYTPRPRP